MKKKAYLIKNIEEFGKFVALCIKKDISVWRLYWNEREKTNRCYSIDLKERRCYYASIDYYLENGYEIIEPKFSIDDFGNYRIDLR